MSPIHDILSFEITYFDNPSYKLASGIFHNCSIPFIVLMALTLHFVMKRRNGNSGAPQLWKLLFVGVVVAALISVIVARGGHGGGRGGRSGRSSSRSRSRWGGSTSRSRYVRSWLIH